MKIVHLCTMDFGGAGKAAYRLHKGLQSIGLDSIMLVISKKTDDPSVVIFPSSLPSPSQNRWASLFKHWNSLLARHPHRPHGLEIFTDTTTDVRFDAIKELQDADVINLHWVAGLFDYEHAMSAFKGKKIVWTLHDMNPFTGGCHYAGSCKAYQQSCGSCPQLGSHDADDLSLTIFQRKVAVYNDLDITVVTPSRWLARCSSTSTLFGRFRHEVIPNGFPLDTFRPLDRGQIRAELGIPANAKVVLFGADYVSNERKGLRFLIEALKRLKISSHHHSLILSVFGGMDNTADISCGFPVLTFGAITGEEQMALLYNAADVFVLPSVEDNLPNTVVESLACGTPVAAFNIGGVPDMVEHGVTGYLAPVGDISALSRALAWCIEAPSGIRDNCRSKAESCYALANQAKNYKNLYEEVSVWNPKATQRISVSLPKISIITPSFNQAEYLEECIDSILSQNYPNLEYIIMDGGSTDGSVEIIKKYEKYLTYWQSQPDGGHYAAINEGFRRSSGEIMAWLNSDDKYHLSSLHIVGELFKSFDNLDWIMGRPTVWDHEGKLVTILKTVPPWTQQLYLNGFYGPPHIQQESTFWRRSLWERAGGYLDTSLSLAGDMELWARFFRYASLHQCDIPLGGFRSHSNQRSKNFAEQYDREAKSIIERERGLFANSAKQSNDSDAAMITARDVVSYTDFGLNEETFPFFFYSRQHHLPLLERYAQELYGKSINWSRCDLKAYQDLFVYTYIRSNITPGARILEVGGGNSRVLTALRHLHECWNLDKFEGVGSGPLEIKTTDFRVVRGYMGEFRPELPANSFDLVFSISVLEHIPSENAAIENVYSDINRVLKPSGISLHCIDAVLKKDSVWEHPVIKFISEKEKLEYVNLRNVRIDSQRFVMNEESYNTYWRSVTGIEYQKFGEPFSCNLLWVKGNNPESDYVKYSDASFKPAISVIVSSYASEEFMRECLEDLVNQTIANQMEIIVIDAASPQDEGAIVREFQEKYPNIRYIRTAERIPIYAAWNLAIRESSGAYIAPFSTNDRLKNDAFEILKHALDVNPAAMLVYGDTYLTRTPHQSFENHTRCGTYEWPDFSFEHLLRKCLVGPHPMWRRAVHDAIGYFDEKYLAIGDQEFWLRTGERFPLLHIPQFTGLYWVDDDALSMKAAREIDGIRALYQQRHATLLQRNNPNNTTDIHDVTKSTAESPPLASIIIPVFNKAELTRQCIEALYQCTAIERDLFEIIIIDNASTDNTQEYLRSLGDKTRIITNHYNLGFARACNQGAQAARGRYLVFLNNDTIPLNGWLVNLLDFISTHSDAGIVGSKLLYPDDTIQHCGASIRHDGAFFRHQYKFIHRSHPLVNRVRELDAVTAACFMTPRELFLKLGGFDEQYLNGCEDMDYCTAVRNAGYKIYYNPDAELYHLESQTPRTNNMDKENFVHYVSKWGVGRMKNEIEIYAEDGFWEQCDSGFMPSSDAEKRVTQLVDSVALEKKGLVAARIYPVVSWKPLNKVMGSSKQATPRILFVCHDFPPYRYAGAQLYALNLAKELNRLGKVEVEVLYPLFREPNAAMYHIRESTFDGVTVHELLKPMVLEPEKILDQQTADLLRQFVTENSYDLIHVHGIGQLSIFAIQGLSSSGIPIVATLHDYWLLCDRWHMVRKDQSICTGPEGIEKCTRCFIEDNGLPDDSQAISAVTRYKEVRQHAVLELFSGFTRVFAPSKYLASIFEKFGFQGVVTVPLGLPNAGSPDHNTSVVRQMIRFGYAGQLILRKGVEYLLDAFSQVPGRVELVVWGDYTGTNSTCSRVRQAAAVDPRIRLMGKFERKDLAIVYNSMDVAVVPSLMENYPLIVLEAYQNGVPVIASNVGGIPEIIDNGRNGLLFEPGSSAAIKEAMLKLIQNPQQIDTLRGGITPVRTVQEDAEYFTAVYGELCACSDRLKQNESRCFAVQFYIYKNVHWPMFEALYEYLKGREDVAEIILCLPNIPNLVSGGSYALVDKLLSLGERVVSSPRSVPVDVTFIADTIAGKVAGCGKIVNVGHGTISKGYYFTESVWTERENWVDLLCVPGEYARERLAPILRTQVAATGMPKLDAVFLGQYNRDLLCHRLELDASKKIVLYAPTFNINLSSLFHFIDRFAELSAPDRYILIKLHGSTLPGYVQQYRELAAKTENVIFIEDANLAPYLAGADIMISDVSSAFMEFMALDKPVILFNNPTQQQYHGFDPENIEYAWRDLGTEVTTFDEAKYILDVILLRGDDGKSSKRKRYASMLFADTAGHASENVWRQTVHLLAAGAKSSSMPVFSIIVNMTEDMLPSVRNLLFDIQLHSVLPIELVLVHEHKKHLDELAMMLKNFGEFCRIVEIDTSALVNHDPLSAGIAAASGEFVLIVREDVNVFKNFDYVLYKTFASNPDVMALTGLTNAPLAELHHDNFLLNESGNSYDGFAYAFINRFRCQDIASYQYPVVPPLLVFRRKLIGNNSITSYQAFARNVIQSGKVNICLSLLYTCPLPDEQNAVQAAWQQRFLLDNQRKVELYNKVLREQFQTDLGEVWLDALLEQGVNPVQLKQLADAVIAARYYDVACRKRLLALFADDHEMLKDKHILEQLLSAAPYNQDGKKARLMAGFSGRVMFYFFKNVHIPILKPIYEACKRLYPDAEIGFACMPYAPEMRAGFLPEELQLIHDIGEKVYQTPQEFQPDITFIADSVYPWVQGCGKLVHVGHGVLSKGQYYTDTAIARREEQADLVCVPGEYHAEVMRRIISKPVVATGMAKLDPLFSGRMTRAIELTRLNLPAHFRYVLFSPTFNDELSAIPYVHNRIAEVLPDDQTVLLIKLHGSTKADYKNMYRELGERHPRVYYCDDLDITPFLAVADLMISDVSSSMMEFAALDKPLVLFNNPLCASYPNYNPADIEFRWRDIGIEVTSLEEMKAAVAYALKTPHFLSSQRRRYTDKLFANKYDGRGAERVVRAAYEMRAEEAK